MYSSFAYKKYSTVITASMGKRPLHSLRDVLLMSWLGPSSSFNLIISTVPTAKERELQMSMKLCLSQSDFDEIAVVTTYILLYGQLSKFCAWIIHHSCTALNWVWTCVLLLFFATNGHGSFHLHCSQVALHSSPDGVVSQVGWDKTSSEKDSPSLSPTASISTAAPSQTKVVIASP